MSETNPLYAFRAPAGIKHHLVDGDHFVTRRQDVVNDSGAFNIYPGMFAYKPDRALEVDLAIWEDSSAPGAEGMKSRANYYAMTTREGFQVCMAKEWDVIEEAAKIVWKRDDAGRLTFGGAGVNTMVLMFRTSERAERAQVEKSRNIREINETPEEKRARLVDKYARLGASVSVELEDDSSDAAMANYEKRLAGKDL